VLSQWYQVELYSTTKSKPSEHECKSGIEIYRRYPFFFCNVQHVEITGTSRISMHSRSDFFNLQRCGTVLCLCTHAIEIFREGQK
jgi:hypothetical protein